MMNRYSLANYVLSIKVPDALSTYFDDISIGGEGSIMNNITLHRNTDIYSTEGYATGGYVHNKNLDKTGSVTISINQLSDKIVKFIRLCNLFYSGDYEGLTLTLKNSNGESIATCIDCYISNIPDQTYTESANEQTWTFTCGEINFNI